jgi:branched-chain amino acid transport system substrate-binding protein
MSQKNETITLILALLVTIGLIVGGAWLFANKAKIFASKSSLRLEDRMSLGEKILIPADTYPNKQAGTKAFAKGNFSTAITELGLSLQNHRNDPEALIYLNNAKANNTSPIKIAVSIPIGGNLNIAKEILRGVAQAQDEVNQEGGINGKHLQVLIANDDNNLTIVSQIANEFVKQSSILAVVGHNTTDASLTAAPIYQQGKLVMISPTSDGKDLPGIGNYIFRTVPSSRFQADTIARYAVKTTRLTNLAICFDFESKYSKSFKDDLTLAIYSEGGKITPTNCDFSASDFSAQTVVSQAVSGGADGLILLPSVNRINQAVEVAKDNQGRLTLLSNATLYTIGTLKQGQADVNGMILAVPWHPQAIPEHSFPKNAKKLWNGQVNWRTAMAYDATQVIISGLKQTNSREGLQSALSGSNFSADGATGKIQFLPSGDRNGAAILVKVQPGDSSGTGYDFKPITFNKN